MKLVEGGGAAQSDALQHHFQPQNLRHALQSTKDEEEERARTETKHDMYLESKEEIEIGQYRRHVTSS